MFRFILFGFSLSIVLLENACSLLPSLRPEGRVVVMTWNVENLFDEVSDGGEYPEFEPEKGWTKQAFWQRCTNLAQVVREAEDGGPDILAFQEIENAHTLEVLQSRFLSSLGYRWSLAAPGGSDGIRTALLAKFPPVRTAVHYPLGKDGEKPLRGILEAEWKIGSRSLVVLNNHWKSRIPDPATTELQRQESAFTLNRRLEELAAREDQPLVLIVGDFNASVELSRSLKYRCMRTATAGADPKTLMVWPNREDARTAWVKTRAAPSVYDLWSEAVDPVVPGTYYYNKQWSKLDHIFLLTSAFALPGWSVTGFHPVARPQQLNRDGSPRAWSERDPQGVSDHLPLIASFHLES